MDAKASTDPRPALLLALALIGLLGCGGAAEATAGTDRRDAATSTITRDAAERSGPATPDETPPPPTALRAGSTGERVRAIEAALAITAFQPGPVDGTFDAATTSAVWAFQALHGHEKEAVVDADLEEQILAMPPLAMLRPDLGPTHVEVDLTRQVMLVWVDGGLRLVTHVSTGSGVPYCEGSTCGDAITPEGTFTVQYRIAGERHAPLGVLHDPVYFDHDGHAVHGDPEVPDHPASHGCVRIPLHVSPVFPALVADGDPIVVFRS